MNSLRAMVVLRVPDVRFQCARYSTTISSTGAMTKGADALIQEPHAVRREMFPSFQMMVE
jgi:hypothetical protein